MKNWIGVVFAFLAMGVFGQTTKEDRNAILSYGIESEVLDLVRTLKAEKNTDYRDSLIAAYDHARGDDLKEAMLLFFLDLKDNGLEDRAIQEISAPDKKGNSLLLNSISYLTEIKSERVKDTLVGLMSNKNKVLALAGIRALGKLGARDKAPEMLKLYNDAETDPNFKPDLIWSFGEMKATDAVDVLLKDYDENESQPLLRRSILEAFGKIGDDRAWDKVEAALQDPNTDVRSAAVATIGSFPGHGDPVALLTSALRDSQTNVRLAGAQAAKVLKSRDLRDLLVYRIKKDPETKVRLAALQAVAAYDDGPPTVLEFLGDKKSEPNVWRESLNLALTQKYPQTFDTLKKVVEADNKDKAGGLAAVVAGAILPQREDYRTLFGLILASDKAPARSIALRAISLGKFTEYESVLKTLADRDPDPGVKAQAAKILKEWSPTPEPDPKK